MLQNPTFTEMLESPARMLAGRVEIYEGETLTKVCGYHDALKSFTVERVGEESKFFGFGIMQKLNAHLIDPHRELEVSTANYLEAEFGVGTQYIYAFPKFNVTEVHRDENTNELSITAYDVLYKATGYTIAELVLSSPYTIRDVAEAIANKLGVPLRIPEGIAAFDTVYENGANVNGSEDLRSILNAIAEATQTIYYINSQWELTFKRLDKDGEPLYTIDKAKYITLDSKTNRRLAAICHATELGDDVQAGTGASGTTQYVRDNPFWDMRKDIAAIVDNAVAAIGGLTINQFNCKWRGNYLLEIGDKIALETKDNDIVLSYVLNDVISFDGFLSQQTQWNFTDNEGESEGNPSTLGEALKKTSAKVDKINQEITLLAQNATTQEENITQLQLDLKGINASVTEIQNAQGEATETINDSIATLSKKVEASMTAEQVQIAVKNELDNGVEKVATSTGYTFDENGLTVEKTNSEMKTQITEDGMKVYKNDEERLVADNEGVKATNLHATTYLIIGTNSRFEDYEGRTGCFWIGG